MKRSGDDEPDGQFHISCGGIDNASGDYINWDRVDLSVGDEITLKILAASIADPNPNRRPHDGDKAEYSKKDYIRKCAKDFGWTIKED